MLTRRSELLALLEPAQHGPFYADSTRFVMATLHDDNGSEINAVYIGWQADKVVISSARPAVDYGHAHAFALAKWAAVPEDIRKRLMSIARP